MKRRGAWGIAVGLAVAVPVVGLGIVAQAAAKDTVQLQSPLDSNGVGHQETTLGDVVADAVRETGQADIGVVAADEITETSIPAGSVAPKTIIGALRYAQDATDTVVVLSLTGVQLRQVAERSISRAPQAFDGFLQVSGLKITYDPSKPEGKRVTHLTAGGSDIADGHSYRVATTRPLAHGSFGYFRFWTDADIKQDTQTSIAASVTAYVDAHKTIDATLEHRILAQ